MPATKPSPELQADIRLLNLRGVLDPKRHYKKDYPKAFEPSFSELGRIIEGPTEYFNARLSGKARKRTFAEDTLASERLKPQHKTRYHDIQATKRSGKKAHYNKLRSRRSRGS